MRILKGVGRFWYDFIIGDDWKIAAAVCVVLLVGAGGVLAGLGQAALFAPLLGAAVAAAFVVALLIDVREQNGR
jgi:hypothetical protein